MEKTRVLEIIDQLDFNSFSKKLEEVINSDIPDINVLSTMMNSMVNKILDITKDDIFAVKVALLYQLKGTVFVSNLLKTGNEDFIRAQLLLEFLRGNSPKLLLNELELAKTMSSITIMSKGFDEHKIEFTNRVFDFLNKYIKEHDFELVNRNLAIDVNDFILELDKVHNDIFNNNEDDLKPLMVRNLFVNDFVLPEVLNYLFSNVMQENTLLRNFDYTSIIEDKPEYLVIIKGLYRKIASDTLDYMFTDIPEEEYSDYDGFFRDIVELNKNDDEGLRWFFREIEKRLLKDKKTYDYFKEQDYFKKYNGVSIDEIYHNNITKLLNGECNIDESVVRNIGSSEEFLNNYDILLDRFCNSKDENYKRALLFPLTVGLIERQKKKYNLDFQISFNTIRVSDSALGTYNHEKNIMYVNPNIFSLIKDVDVAFVETCNTIFHETRHANQHKEVETSDEFNFDNLIMAIDFYLSTNRQYYANNYIHISYERDARAMAHVDTMALFEKYPEFQTKEIKLLDRDYHLSDYVRKTHPLDYDVYYGIIYMFVSRIRSALELAKTNEKFRDVTIEDIKKYPVFFKFFKIDLENYTIDMYDGSYYIDLYKKCKNTDSEKQITYSVNSFLYALQVSRYLENRKNNDFESQVGYNDEILKEIDENVKKRT